MAVTVKISPLRPYMLFTDSQGNLTKEAYDFLQAMFLRVGGSLSSLNAATLENQTWEQPGQIGVTTPSSGKFTTLTTLNAVTLSPINANVTLQPSGSGTVVINPASVLGSIDLMSIGQTVPSSGKFTVLQSTGAFGCNGKSPQSSVISGGSVSTTSATNTTPYGFTTAAQANDIVTKLNTVIAALTANGILS